jgi:hypothetical protein
MNDTDPKTCSEHGDVLIWEPGGDDMPTVYGRWYCPSCQRRLMAAFDASGAREIKQALVEQHPTSAPCGCFSCRTETGDGMTVIGGMKFLSVMVLCPDCGNKRCPKATRHDQSCTGSNDTGQEGSRYA